MKNECIGPSDKENSEQSQPTQESVSYVFWRYMKKERVTRA
jgi:hypothetical protein